MMFCCTHHWSCENHWDARIFLYAYIRVKYFYLLFILYTGCIMWKEHFLICKMKCSLSGKNDNAETEPILKKICDEHWPNNVSDVLPLTMFLLFCERCCAYWLVFNLHLCMFDWGFPLRTHITCDISDIIVPRLIKVLCFCFCSC